MFEFESKGREKKRISQLKTAGQEEIPSYSGESQRFCPIQVLNWFGWGLSTLGKAICFIQSTKCKCLPHPENNVWANVWAPHGPVQLTNKMNHHTPLPMSASQIEISNEICMVVTERTFWLKGMFYQGWGMCPILWAFRCYCVLRTLRFRACA